MKKIFTFLVSVAIVSLFTGTLWAQSPEKMSYQAVIRNSSDALVTNTQIGVQISILQSSESGSAVYTETHTPTTNANGLVSFEIGSGSVLSGDFSTIDWSADSYFIKSETDLDGGTNYTITGTNQLLSVPYALHAKTAEAVTGGITETDPTFTAWDKTSGIAIEESQITDLQNYLAVEADPSVPSGTQTGQMQYWDGTAWITVETGNEGQVLTFTGGVPTWTTQVGVNDVLNPVTGRIWMDRNLGASQVATSSSDVDAYGDLYQWGRGTDGHEKITSVTTTALSNDDMPGHGDFIISSGDPFDWRSPQNANLWQSLIGANNPCPNGYRLPTEAEWEAERLSWSSNNAAGAFASPLKLPSAGRRTSSGISAQGSVGYYWTSTTNGTGSMSIRFGSGDAGMLNYDRDYGFCVRCIKD